VGRISILHQDQIGFEGPDSESCCTGFPEQPDGMIDNLILASRLKFRAAVRLRYVDLLVSLISTFDDTT